MNLSCRKKIEVLWLFIITVILYLIHFQIIVKDPVLTRDDVLFVDQMKNIDSLSGYFSSLIKFQLEDLQPVRDFTFYLNKSWAYSYHLVNFILAICLLLAIYWLLSRLKILNVIWNLMIVTFIAFHPLFNVLITWISARKYSLSALFIVSYIICKIDKKNFLGTAFFVLSVMSHPMYVVIPASIWIIKIITKRTVDKNDLILIIMSIIMLVINFYYYFNRSLILPFYDYSNYQNSLTAIILSLGRSFFQIVLPFRITAEYDKASVLNWIGYAFPIFLYILERKNIKRFIVFFIVYVGSFLPSMQYFVRDGYLIGPLVVLSIYIAIIISEFNRMLVKIGVYVVIGILFIFNSYKTIEQEKYWFDTTELFRVSFVNEGGFIAGFAYAKMISATNPEHALNILEYLLNNYRLYNPELGLIAGQSIYFKNKSAKDRREELIELLTKYPGIEGVWTRYFGSLLLIELGEDRKALNLLERNISPKMNYYGSIDKVKEALRQFCQKYPNEKACVYHMNLK